MQHGCDVYLCIGSSEKERTKKNGWFTNEANEIRFVDYSDEILAISEYAHTLYTNSRYILYYVCVIHFIIIQITINLRNNGIGRSHIVKSVIFFSSPILYSYTIHYSDTTGSERGGFGKRPTILLISLCHSWNDDAHYNIVPALPTVKHRQRTYIILYKVTVAS